MDKVDLRKLKRNQLLELMLLQQETIEEQAIRIQSLEATLQKREIVIQKAGSIAEAALSLNGIFEAAQAAADQYLASVKLSCKERMDDV